jgi:hypothetical protein
MVNIRPPDGNCRPTLSRDNTTSLIDGSFTKILLARYNQLDGPHHFTPRPHLPADFVDSDHNCMCYTPT